MRTTIEKQIIALLERRQEIDRKQTSWSREVIFTENYRWLIDATELLLRSLLEIHEELRNAGILR